MAHKLILPGNARNNFIWNISERVGDAVNCPNRPNDVALVKILIAEWIRYNQPNIHASCKEPFQVGSGMNLRTAYWIRVINQTHVLTGSIPNISWTELGVLSPARGSGDLWSITRLNNTLKNRMPSVWENLPNHQACTPSLRAELLA